MKVVILAGGLGTRLSEETSLKPKPMVEIGGMPILWHILKIYSSFGLNDFIICLGYKGNLIKEYFANYRMYNSDITFDLSENQTIIHKNLSEPWKITCIDTGLHTMTGGRLKHIKEQLDNETFCMTYGDGVGNVDITQLIQCHQNSGRLATITAVQPPGRFGNLDIDSNGNVLNFQEKPKDQAAWINGGFFVLEPKVLDYIDSDSDMFEKSPLEKITNDSQLNSFKHHGFWKPMDTLRDKNELCRLWESNNAPWRTWND